MQQVLVVIVQSNVPVSEGDQEAGCTSVSAATAVTAATEETVAVVAETGDRGGEVISKVTHERYLEWNRG